MIATMLVAAPFAAALLQLLAGSDARRSALRLGLTLSLALLALGTYAIWRGADPVAQDWFRIWGTDAVVRFALHGDGFGRWLALLTLLLGPVALLGAYAQVGQRLSAFCAGLFVLQGCLVGAFLAADLVLFYIFFEAGLLPAVVLVALFGGGGEEPRRAAMQFLVYTMAGSIGMLVAIWYLATETGTLAIAELGAASAELSADARLACFAAFALAFAVKTPLWPLHGWQAPLYAASPASASVVIAGAMAKLGVYGFLCVLVPSFPQESAQFAWLFITLGVIAVIYGALLALAQQDLKRLLAFSSLSHLGLVVVGIFSFHAVALDGVLLQVFAHGLAVAALFLLVGQLEAASGRCGIDDFGALARRAPTFAALLLGAALVAVALPGTLAFVGEAQLLYGIFAELRESLGVARGLLVTILAALSLILGAAYILRMVQRLNYGAPRRDDDALPGRDVGLLAVAVLLALSVGLGLYPRAITDRAGSLERYTAAARGATLVSGDAERGENDASLRAEPVVPADPSDPAEAAVSSARTVSAFQEPADVR